MLRLCTALLVLATAGAEHTEADGDSAIDASSTDFEAILRPLWNQTDADGNNELSYAEFVEACDRLGVEASIFTAHSQDFQVVYNDLDQDNDNGLTVDEFASAASRFQQYEKPLVRAFTNNAGVLPASIGTVPTEVAASESKIVATVTLAGSIGDIYPGTRTKIRDYYAVKCGVPSSSVVQSFLPGSVIVQSTIFVPDEEAADLAKANLPTTAAALNAEPAFSGLTVTSDPSYSVEATEPVSIPLAGGIAGGVFVLSLFTCFMVSIGSNKTRKKKGVAPSGCCSTGCCSFFAVKQWAMANFLALLLIAGSLGYLFTQVNGLQDVFVGLIDVLLELRTSTYSAVQDLYQDLPTEVLDQLEQQKSHAELLRFYVLGPGVLAVVFLVLASMAASLRARKGTYCCTKLFVILANVFLIVALVFYGIFAGTAVVVSQAPAALKENLRRITGICDTVPVEVEQLIADSKHALSLMAASGQNTTSLQTQVADGEVLSVQVSKGCDHLTDFFDEMVVLFVPGVLCCCAIAFALFCNNMLCCAAGCCKAPPKNLGDAKASQKV